MKLIRVKDFNKFEKKNKLGELLELLVDTKKGQAYHVYPNIGHSKVAAEYLNIPENDINSYNAGHLVSALVEIDDNDVVKSINIGRSSLELGHKVEHTEEQLEKAKLIVENIVKLSKQLDEVEVVKDIKKHELVFH